MGVAVAEWRLNELLRSTYMDYPKSFTRGVSGRRRFRIAIMGEYS